MSREDRQEAYRRLTLKPYSLLTKASVIKLAEVLDAGEVIFGRFELQEDPTAGQSRGRLRITAQVLDLRRIHEGPEFVAIGAMEDLAALQTHLAWQTLQTVTPKSAPSEEEFHRRRPPVRVDAMEYYIRGLLATGEEQKHHFFAQAARLDPGFSQPCFQLGKLNWSRKTTVPRRSGSTACARRITTTGPRHSSAGRAVIIWAITRRRRRRSNWWRRMCR